MTAYSDDAQLSSADSAVERALASVPQPVPRPEFLTALREQFTNPATPGAARSAEDARHGASLQFAQRRSRQRLPRFAVAAGIMAIAGTGLALWAFDPWAKASWSPVDGHLPASPIIVDGVSIPPSGLSRSMANASVAHTIATGPESLWLQLGDRMLFELAPGTEIELGPVSPRGEPLAMTTRKGALRLCTGVEFAGSRLDVATPDFDLEVTGTSFGIDIDKDGTCVCCLEGPVLVKAREAAPWTVESGRMCRIYNDGRAPKWDALSDKHGPPLKRFDEQADALMH